MFRFRFDVHRLLFVLAFFPSVSLSQSFSGIIDHITTEKGLSHNTVSSVTQDSRGFIWIGTIDGLNRFDGYTCRIFKHDPANPHSLSSSFIHNVSEDHSGTLWVTTRDGGLNRFNYNTEEFTSYLHDPNDPTSIASNKVGTVYEDSQGKLWVTSDAGINLFDRTTGKVIRYSHDSLNPASLSDNEITGIVEDPDGFLWIATDNGLNKFDPRNGRSTRFFFNPSNPNSLSDNRLVGTLITRDGRLWVGTRAKGVNILDRVTGKFTRLVYKPNDPKSPGSIYASPALEDEKGNVWLGTHEGVNVFDPRTGIFRKIPHNPGSVNSISNSTVSSIFRDNVGDIWIGTWGGGVDKISRRKQKFETISTLTSPGLLANDFVLAMLLDRRGNLWVGSGSGLMRSPEHNKSNRLTDAGIWSVMENIDSSVWAATTDEGIKVFSSEGRLIRTFQYSPHDTATLPDKTIRTLYRDKSGTIWAGAQSHGLASFDAQTQQWTRYPYGKIDGRSVSDEVVWAINQDRAGHLWFGTYVGGVNEFDPQSRSFTYYQNNPADSTSLPVNDVRTICVAKSGDIWLGTFGGGICRFNSATRTFVRITDRNGLANNFVYGILEDGDSTLWISTNKGISHYNPFTTAFRNYTALDGLQGDEFNTGAYYKRSDGELFFGGVTGMNRFFPHDIKENDHIPPVMLTQFKVFDKEFPTSKSLTMVDSIRLRYDQSYFSFEFAALDYVDPPRNQYAYKLEGFNDKWIYSGTRRYASYTNLDPGSYVLHVKGSNSDGVWNEAGKKLYLTIVPPFWMTAWFKILVMVILAGLFAGIVRFISTRKLKEQLRGLEKERALQEERERISRDLHDNVGAQLSGLITGLELAEKFGNRPDHAKSNSLISTLRDDARLTMSQLRETIWAMGSSSMSLREFFESVEAYGKKLVQHIATPRIHFSFESEKNVTLSPIQVLHLFRIAQEALTNALKHANASNIYISLRCEKEKVVLCIRDDGQQSGTQQEEVLSGYGFTNM
ncbi:MAG: two-component regulator propeller domain-containing protein, partial [bacterium]